MKYKASLMAIVLMLPASLTYAKVFLEIDIKNEIDLKDGTYIAREYEGQGRFALISHSHGTFEDQDIAEAECSDGYVVSKLPEKFNKVKKHLKAESFVFTNCKEASGAESNEGAKQPPQTYSNQEKSNNNKKPSIEDIIRKNSGKISSLGFQSKILKSKLYLKLDFSGATKEVMTFESFVALLFESKRITQISRVTYGKFEGVRTKIPGFPSSGVLFNPDAGDIFPSHLLNGAEVIKIQTEEEMFQVSLALLRMIEN